MKILYAHLYDAAFKIGGAEKVLIDIAGAMKRDYKEDVRCAVNRGDIGDFFRELDIPIVEISWPKTKTLHTLAQMQQAIRNFSPDVIHSHHRYTTFLLDLFFKRDNRILHTEHVLRQDKRWLFRYGHLANGVHESVTQNLIQYFHVPPEHAKTIPNAVRVADPAFAKMTGLQKRFPRRQTEFYILVIGRFEEQKGHIYLVHALELLPVEVRCKIKILLAGTGSLEGAIREAVRRSGLENSFEFLGHTKEIPELLAFCDFLILPSLFEGMPLSILEAYAAGKTVIATDIPGSRELVRHGKTGLLVALKNPEALAAAIRQLAEHPEQIRGLAAAAHELSKKEYSYAVMTKRYHELYQTMIREIHGR
jgi:glycosyltransferase involved in cell wall biosynthesis